MIDLKVNGKNYAVDVSHDTPLLWVLRDSLGLTAALYGAITFERGRVQQGNFNDYPMLRLKDMPAVEVHIVPSTDRMGGVGEPGVPPIAPDVANAIFAATGRRIRRLPIRSEDMKKI